MNEIHLERIPPDSMPNGVVIRICSSDELIVEEKLNAGHVVTNLTERIAAQHFDQVQPYLKRGETVRTYFYDGDTGECMGTIIVNGDKT